MVAKSQVAIRCAKATFQEGVTYATFLDQAADGFFRFMLGRDFAEVIADVFSNPAHDFSFTNVIFAEQDAQVVGMASGFTGQQHADCSDAFLVKAKGFPTLRMMTMQLVFGSMWRFLDTAEIGDFYLQAVAVSPDLRGRGVGSMLMDAMEERAAKLQADRFVLDVATKNEVARRLYEHRGMSVIAKWPKRFLFPPFRILRMAKPLTAPIVEAG